MILRALNSSPYPRGSCFLLLLLLEVLLYEPCLQLLASARVLLRLLLLLLLLCLQLHLLAVPLLQQGPRLQHLQHLRNE